MDVLSGETSERHREIESHTDFAATVIGEVVHLAIGFLGTFTGQDFQVFEGRGIDGRESIATVNPASGFHQLLAWDHGSWKKIPEAFESSWFDECHRIRFGWKRLESC